jgi:hypothetical protein
MCFNAWFIYLGLLSPAHSWGSVICGQSLCLYSALVNFPYLAVSLVRLTYLLQRMENVSLLLTSIISAGQLYFSGLLNITSYIHHLCSPLVSLVTQGPFIGRIFTGYGPCLAP